MNTKYFYLALTPTKTALEFIYSFSFKIVYDDSTDLSAKQTAYESQFRAFNDNPMDYNTQWSSAYKDLNASNTNRTGEIDALKNGGKVVKPANWPEKQ